MRSLLSLTSNTPSFQRLRECLRAKPAVVAQGVPRAARAFVLAALRHPDSIGTTIVVTPTPESAEELVSDLDAMLASENDAHKGLCYLFPTAEWMVSDAAAVDVGAVKERLEVLERLTEGRRQKAEGSERPDCLLPSAFCLLVVTSLAALCHPTLPPDLFRRARFALKRGETVNREDLAGDLIDAGFERVSEVERVGQFSVRGGIVDVFPPIAAQPFRIELFGDEIDSIRVFDLNTQRSVEQVESCLITPPREIILTKSIVAPAAQHIHDALDARLQELRRRGMTTEANNLEATIARDVAKLEDLSYFEGVERYAPFLYPHLPLLLDYLSDDALVVFVEPTQLEMQHQRLTEDLSQFIASKAERGEMLPPQVGNGRHAVPTVGGTAQSPFPTLTDVGKRCEGKAVLMMTTEQQGLGVRVEDWGFATTLNPQPLPLHFTLPPTFGGRLDPLLEQLRHFQREGKKIVLATNHSERLREILRDGDVVSMTTNESQLDAGIILVASRRLSGGFIFAEADLVLLTNAEIFGWVGFHKRRRHRDSSVALRTVEDLKEGDYVVHISHGIGIYRGVVRQTVAGAENDYILIQYAGADRLYVPVQQLDRIQRYVGADGFSPPLNSLGGRDWENTKRKVREATKEIAEELAKLYAAREQADGVAYSPDTPWQREMEASFDYEETPDQFKAVEDVKKDMEQPKPMDRLVCGDVGYGKTEVAIRAAFKAAQDGKQVAVLCPTTVLAQQHYNTFRERMSPYPIRVEMLSRFRSPQEQKKIIDEVRLGGVDVLIGTHRVISQDVKFKDLGLVVVDEEQRFGVMQKERLKQLRQTVDVLTLTATPIPRTLHMTLSGLREMSLIEDPPEGRVPIRTYVMKYNEGVIRQAIRNELDRGGQVFYLFNRVQGIRHVAEKVKQLVPNARVAVGHGQMSEDKLEGVMMDFFDGKVDVLVCTTIIENGLDVPNANTMIIERAELLGLAQMYQLRGRIGRSNRQAHAYFFFGSQKLTPEAEQRFEALREFSDLGSGFKIALRDLEIRGAGNLLGVQQSGHMSAVGYEMYVEMLQEAIKEIRHEPVPQKIHLPEIDLPVSAFLPTDYIESLEQRLAVYRKMANVESVEDVDGIEKELRDRYGVLPLAAQNLVRLLRMRLLCYQSGVSGIAQQERQFVVIKFATHARLTDAETIGIYKRLATAHPKDVMNAVMVRLDGIAFRLSTLHGQRLLRVIEDAVNELAAMRSA
jgi:transcription-repair coupling factor (superfamily II helicase)